LFRNGNVASFRLKRRDTFPSYGNFISPVEKSCLPETAFAWLIWLSRSSYS